MSGNRSYSLREIRDVIRILQQRRGPKVNEKRSCDDDARRGFERRRAGHSTAAFDAERWYGYGYKDALARVDNLGRDSCPECERSLAVLRELAEPEDDGPYATLRRIVGSVMAMHKRLAEAEAGLESLVGATSELCDKIESMPMPLGRAEEESDTDGSTTT